jgi:hypothetical protein
VIKVKKYSNVISFKGLANAVTYTDRFYVAGSGAFFKAHSTGDSRNDFYLVYDTRASKEQLEDAIHKAKEIGYDEI